MKTTNKNDVFPGGEGGTNFFFVLSGPVVLITIVYQYLNLPFLNRNGVYIFLQKGTMFKQSYTTKDVATGKKLSDIDKTLARIEQTSNQETKLSLYTSLLLDLCGLNVSVSESKSKSITRTLGLSLPTDCKVCPELIYCTWKCTQAASEASTILKNQLLSLTPTSTTVIAHCRQIGSICKHVYDNYAKELSKTNILTANPILLCNSKDALARLISCCLVVNHYKSVKPDLQCTPDHWEGFACSVLPFVPEEQDGSDTVDPTEFVFLVAYSKLLENMSHFNEAGLCLHKALKALNGEELKIKSELQDKMHEMAENNALLNRPGKIIGNYEFITSAKKAMPKKYVNLDDLYSTFNVHDVPDFKLN